MLWLTKKNRQLNWRFLSCKNNEVYLIVSVNVIIFRFFDKQHTNYDSN